MKETISDMLKRHEGLRLKPYRCSAGKLTIGYGRNIEEAGISKQEAEYLLHEDILRARLDLLTVLPEVKHMNEIRQNALIDMMFNLGRAKFLQFQKMLEALKRQDFNRAADEMLDSLWASQVGMRARELADMIRKG